jgi:NADH-quinone oxidoreductase subunit N
MIETGSSYPLPDLVLALPELVLALGGMALLMLGVFRGDGSTRLVLWSAVGLMTVAAIVVALQPAGEFTGFGNAFIVDPFSRFVKLLVLGAAATTLLMAQDFIRLEKMERFEFVVLTVFATLGMLMMVSANDFIALYMGLELQSLALYVLAAFNRDSLRSTEAGLKYFVLGALSSGLLLYGCSLVYGFSGSTSFQVIAQASAEPNIGLVFGLVFVTAGLAFKISAVPFHMWTPDVYEGAPTPITAFFAAAPKMAAMALFVRALIGPFPEMVDEWRQIIVFVSIGSMLLGAFAAIGQTNIKRLMAYSSIGHMGFALVGLAAGTQEGVQGVLIYLTIYLAMNIGAFVCILSMRRKEGMVEQIDDLAGLSVTRPGMAFALLVILFSMIGIPPFAGFFAKFYVFLAAINAELYGLAVVGMLASVVSAYYYLRILKIIYFDEPAEPFEGPMPNHMGAILVASTLFVMLYAAPAALITGWAGNAAASLFN